MEKQSSVCFKIWWGIKSLQHIGYIIPKWAASLEFLKNSGSQTLFPRSAASASPGNVLATQILRPQPRPTKSKMMGMGPSNLCFNQPLRQFWCMLTVENYCFRIQLYSKVSGKVLFRISRIGSESASKLQRFHFASKVCKTFSHPTYLVCSWWVAAENIHSNIFKLR